MFIQSTLAAAATLALTACASNMGAPTVAFSQSGLPAAVQVPAGHKVAVETVGMGQITYECRAKKDLAGQFEWVFVGPDAKLMSRNGQQVVNYQTDYIFWKAV
ncbi:DUF3455 domain-containing protein [Hydrogenophaga sp.]|uniref:DUF3455 domain-containing protein n=1 Tax=Hydrogenophaga sp. TaxID=1904254 RepID=UPI0035269B59